MVLIVEDNVFNDRQCQQGEGRGRFCNPSNGIQIIKCFQNSGKNFYILGIILINKMKVVVKEKYPRVL